MKSHGNREADYYFGSVAGARKGWLHVLAAVWQFGGLAVWVGMGIRGIR